MLFKKITYQGIRNYELWKKKIQQKQSTNSTAHAEHSRNSTMEKSKGKVEEEKCESKVYVEVFL